MTKLIHVEPFEPISTLGGYGKKNKKILKMEEDGYGTTVYLAIETCFLVFEQKLFLFACSCLGLLLLLFLQKDHKFWSVFIIA